MTKLAAILSGFVLIVLIGGTAVFTIFAGRSAFASCGVSLALGADLGAPFTLVNGAGETTTDKEVLQRPSLVYFGYTYCPDVCPLDMARNALAVDLMDDNGAAANLVFITIDPARDTPEELTRYGANLHPKTITLTGTDQQIAEVAAAYRVQYSRNEIEDGFYLMDHTTATYLMLPGNRFAGAFDRADSAETIAEKSACIINQA